MKSLFLHKKANGKNVHSIKSKIPNHNEKNLNNLLILLLKDTLLKVGICHDTVTLAECNIVMIVLRFAANDY